MSALTKDREKRVCIFCGGLPLSKEHVYAAWMGKYLYAGNTLSVHTTQVLELSEDGRNFHRIKLGHKKRGGDNRSRKLKVVCASCNNGWMSDIQRKCKDILTPLICGNWMHLPVHSQNAIAQWACMFTMVYEREDPESAVIQQDERDLFYKNKQVPAGWVVLIGRSDPLYGTKIATRHRKWKIGNQLAAVQHPGAQITVANPNQLCIVTVSTDPKYGIDVSLDILDIIGRFYGLIRVWPPVEQNLFCDPKPPTTIDEAKAMSLIDEAWQALEENCSAAGSS